MGITMARHSLLVGLPHLSGWTIQDRHPGADIDVVVRTSVEGQRGESVTLCSASHPTVQRDDLDKYLRPFWKMEVGIRFTVLKMNSF